MWSFSEKNTTHVELGFSLFSMCFGANGVVCRTGMVSSISVLVGGSVVVWWSPSLQVLLFPTEVHFTRCFLSLLRGRHRLCDPGRHCPSDIEKDSAPHVTVFSCFVCLTERNIHGGFFFWSTSCSCQWTWSVCALRALSLIFGEDDADLGEEVHSDAPCIVFARLQC